MLNAMPRSMTLLCLALSLLSLSATCLMIAHTVHDRLQTHKKRYLFKEAAAFLFFVVWSMLLCLAVKDLTFDRVTTLAIRWAMLIYPLVCIMLALTEHEWTMMIPGFFAALTVPFFETSLGTIFPYELAAMLLAMLVEVLFRLIPALRANLWSMDLRSIQEAVDAIDEGLMFTDEKGRILLSNRTMEALSTSLCHQDLKNGGQFWNALKECGSTDFITKVSTADSFLFRFTGGNTWTLYREEFQIRGKDFVQYVALNITDSDHVQRQILLRKADLGRTAEQLQQVKDTIDRMCQEEAKAERGSETFDSITDKMASLNRFFTDHYALPAETFDYKRLAVLTSGLLEEMEHAPAMTAEERLSLAVSAFALLSIPVTVEGELPEAEDAADVCVDMIREACINAVIHGNATAITVTMEQTEEAFLCEVSNNGSLPEKTLNPGGGITGIRRALFPLNGQLEITMEPVFSLKVKIPNQNLKEE
ncbi:MAG: hypothetical protein IJP11_03325 [Oscillospiraceae bacterium]|nr:hypothetical protein [Oscillospiraceae bacterium]